MAGSSAPYHRYRAVQLRKLAKAFRDPEIKHELFMIANECDQLAEKHDQDCKRFDQDCKRFEALPERD